MIEIIDFLIAFLILTFTFFDLNVYYYHYNDQKLIELKVLNDNCSNLAFYNCSDLDDDFKKKFGNIVVYKEYLKINNTLIANEKCYSKE
ncbi:MAG: hypothetical protein ABGW69_01435 [Nanoarchaeota archaeon]